MKREIRSMLPLRMDNSFTRNCIEARYATRRWLAIGKAVIDVTRWLRARWAFRSGGYRVVGHGAVEEVDVPRCQRDIAGIVGGENNRRAGTVQLAQHFHHGLSAG